MPPHVSPDEARAAVARRDWPVARALFSEADLGGELGAEDLEAWGLAALLVGEDAESDAVRERAHYAFVDAGDRDGAARVAFWLGLTLTMRGEQARGSGWVGRLRSLLGDSLAGSVWPGYLVLNEGMRALFAGDIEASLVALGQALATADRFGDLALRVLAGNGHGQAILAAGDVRRGLAELDEVMVLATTSAVTPQAVGLVYCAVISVCRACLDLTRSAEWTEVLARWCEAQPGLVPYRGQCLVHRSEVLQMRGMWAHAETEVRTVIARLGEVPHDVAAGMAHYQLGELCRLQGRFEDAEDEYRLALWAGEDPQPGLALLRLAQGRVETALLAVRRALDETRLPFARTRLLPAAVEICVAAQDLTLAQSLTDELEGLAEAQDSPYLDAAANTARGAVRLAMGEPSAALAALRAALQAWSRLDARYEAARCRVLIAHACDALGDEETTALEREAARVTFKALSAQPDLSELTAHAPDRGAGAAGPPMALTPREMEVLRLVATGATNREIASFLVLSEKTVARHVANIFIKLGVSSRSAATAFAHSHHIV